LIVLNKWVILRPDRVVNGDLVEDVVMRVYRLHMEVKDLFRLARAWLHAIDGIDIGFGIGELECATALLSNHTQVRIGCGSCLSDHLS